MSATNAKAAHEVIVIGAGPAGLAAASEAARAGLDTLLVDENAAPGGQIYRGITATPVSDRSVLGRDYWAGKALVAEARSSGASIMHGTMVWTLDPDLNVGLSISGRSQVVTAKRVVIATGAMERPFPIPGWTLPGVMTAGAAQTLLKSSGIVPSGTTVLAGTGPLLWLLAAQMLRAGVAIEAILDTTPKGNLKNALPHAAGFLVSPLAIKGAALMMEVARKVRIVRRVCSLVANGENALESITYATAGGAAVTIPVDQLLLHQGVVPNTNLAMAAGIKHDWDELQHCWRPALRENGRTSIDGIFVAGDGAGIAGAVSAELRGRLAALEVARDLVAPRSVPDSQAIRQRLQREERARRFLDTIFEPAKAMRLPVDGAIVCRCEEVTAGEVRDAARLRCRGPNQLKAFLRAGMGPCQGRMCGLTLTELIADTNGVTPGEVGHLRIRPPVKPISLAELADMPFDEAAIKAVARG